jgi:hypothetical protein
MEFKGTKGKWHIEEKKASIFDDNGDSVTCWYGVGTSTFWKNEVELKANSLLISKAPEMLAMLIKCKNTLKDVYECDVKDIEQLIKETTTLPDKFVYLSIN